MKRATKTPAFDGWTITRQLNEDRSVFACADAAGRPAIIKIPRRGALSVLGRPDPARSRELLEHEANLLRSWQDIENVVRIYEWHPSHRPPYLVMEELGRSLEDEIPANGLPEEVVFQLIIQVARALEQIHARGEAHNDVKPDNICRRGGTEWVILDPAHPDMCTEDYGPEAFIGPARDLIALGRTFITAWTGSMDVELSEEYVEPLNDMGAEQWVRCLRRLLRGHGSATSARRAAVAAFRAVQSSVPTQDLRHTTSVT